MHILIIPSWYKKDQKDTTGSFFEEQARMLQKKGHEVRIFFPFATKIRKDLGLKVENDNGLLTYRLGIEQKSYSPALTLFKLPDDILENFNNYCEEFGKPDLIHAHSVYSAGVISQYINSIHKIPYIITEHLTALLVKRSGFKSKLKFFLTISRKKKSIANAYNRAEKVICVSSFLKDGIEKVYNISKNKIEVIPNIVNDNFFVESNEQKNEVFTITTIGGLIERKNVDLLLNAFSLVLKDKKIARKMQLHIIGDGSLMNDLVEKAKKLEIFGRVKFFGNLSREKVAEEIAKSHVVISTSKFETFGVTLIEGLAHGVPIIATDSGGPQDIIEKGDGYIVKDHNSNAVAEAIITLVNNYDSFDSDEIKKRCFNRFSEEAVYKQIIELYKSII